MRRDLRGDVPLHLKLAFAAIVIEIIVGIGAGIISAVKQYSFWDVFVTLSTSILVSLPVFWLGLMLQYVFGIWLKECDQRRVLPARSRARRGLRSPTGAYLILPAITLASVSTAYAARIMRSQLLEVSGQDYVRTAHAKGLSARGVLWSHAMKNALIPVVTFIGLDLGAMLSGAILTETVFNWPGVGLHDLPRHRAARLPGRLRRRHDHPVRGHGRQPARRHLLRVPRSEDPLRRRSGVSER